MRGGTELDAQLDGTLLDPGTAAPVQQGAAEGGDRKSGRAGDHGTRDTRPRRFAVARGGGIVTLKGLTSGCVSSYFRFWTVAAAAAIVIEELVAVWAEANRPAARAAE